MKMSNKKQMTSKKIATKEIRSNNNTLDLWEVFIRAQSGTSHRHVGSLHAADKESAINYAREVYTRRNEGRSIWVVRSDNITASNPSKKGPFFEPAKSKLYRYPTYYNIPKEVKKI